MCEVAIDGANFTILEIESHGLFSLDLIGNLCRAEGYEYVVVAMAMHQRGGVRRDFYLEDPHILILQSQVMRRFGGDFDFRRGLVGSKR